MLLRNCNLDERSLRGLANDLSVFFGVRSGNIALDLLQRYRYNIDSDMMEFVKSESYGALTDDEAHIPVRVGYSFKKRKPMPGAYPKNFSPYTLFSTPATRAVSLSRPDIRNDLLLIQKGLVDEFSSKYFDESDGTMVVTPGREACVEVFKPKPVAQQKNVRVSRRAHLSVIQAPINEAEERRQLRAALKASQLLSVCPADTGLRLSFGADSYLERRG